MSITNDRVAVWDDEKQTAAENRKPSTWMYDRHKDMVIGMKISEATSMYRAQLAQQRGQRKQLLEQKKKLEKEAGIDQKNEAGVTLELSEEYQKRMQELQEKIDVLYDEIKQNEKGLDKITETEVGIFNAVSSKNQAEALQEYGEDMAKCLEIARRISNGDKVPATDEKKLMDFNMEIYMAAKNMAVMNMDKKHKEYDTLWGDEEEKEYDDPDEIASNSEINIAEPAGTPVDAAGEPQA